MGKGILSGVFWGIVASMLVAVVLTALSPPPDEVATAPERREVPVDNTIVSEAVEPKPEPLPEPEPEPLPEPPQEPLMEPTPEPAPEPTLEPSRPPELPATEAEPGSEGAEPAPLPEAPDAAEIVPEAPQVPQAAPEIEAPAPPKIVDAVPDAGTEDASEPAVEASPLPKPLPELVKEAAPSEPAAPADLPAPDVVAELAVPDTGPGIDVASGTENPSSDPADRIATAAPGLAASASGSSLPTADRAAPARPGGLDGPEMVRPDLAIATAPIVGAGDDGVLPLAEAPILAGGSGTPGRSPSVSTERVARAGALGNPETPAPGAIRTDLPSAQPDVDDAARATDALPERMALAVVPSDTLPRADTRPAEPQPAKPPEAPAAQDAPKPEDALPVPKAAPAPVPETPKPEAAAPAPEVETPAPEEGAEDRAPDLPQVVSPGNTRPGGLPRVRRLGQLGSASIGSGGAGPGLSSRMPRITAPGAEPAEPVLPEIEDAPPIGALERNAAEFADDSGRPLMALVVLGSGEVATLVSRIDGLGGPVTVALDPGDPATRGVAPDLKAGGHEVLILAGGLPADPTPRDVEVTLGAFVTDYPDAVGILLPPDSALATDRALLKQAMEFAASSGHVVVTAQSGLDTAGRIAIGAGARALGVYRRLDAAGESATTISRYLDRATFQAARDGGVVVLGGLGEQTISGLTAWRNGLRADSVVLAPLSALLLDGS